MTDYDNVLQEMKSSPLYVIAPLFEGVSMLVSIYAIYITAIGKKNTFKKFRSIIIFTLLWNILTQAGILYLYNVRLNDEAFNSVMWLLINGVMTSIVFTDLLILECYQSLIEFITTKTITRLKISLVLFYFLANSFIFMRLLLIDHLKDYGTLEKFLGIGYICVCVLYDNAQVFYLTMLVYRRKGKKNTEEAERELWKTVKLSILVCLIDWVAILVFVIQLFIPEKSIQLILHQVSTSAMGIHESMLIFVFWQLRDLTFAGRQINIKVYKVKSISQIPSTKLRSNLIE